MRVIFVGIHNKPGKEPLDSTTLTGKVIDKIIAKIKAVENIEIVKSNLFDVEYLPTIKENSIYLRKWILNVYRDEMDIVVLLGSLVCDVFKTPFHNTLNTVKLKHPAGIFGPKNKNEYIDNAAISILNTIDKIKAIPTIPIIEKSNDILKMTNGASINTKHTHHNLGVVGIKFVIENNDTVMTFHTELDKPIESIINEFKYKRKWVGGKFQSIRLNFNIGMEYCETYLDIYKIDYSKLLKK